MNKYCYKGIRFAEPVQRFKPPVPYAAGFDHAKANRGDYPQCTQPDGGLAGSATGGEDCLRLDVYQPSGKSNLPIYIWIHGGHFKMGSGQFYDGHQFTKNEDIVYVTIQYRLGVYGFLNVKDSNFKGNF